MNRVPLALLLLGCPTTDGGKDAPEDTDTAAGVDSGNGEDCSVQMIAVSPNPDAVGVYYRDPIVLSFDGDGSSASWSLTAPDGSSPTLSAVWGDGNTMVTLSGTLAPATTYTLGVDICGAEPSVSFTTSSLGSFDLSPSDLVDRTYSFALADAEIIQPAVLEAFDDAKLITPLGFMVQNADDTSMELLGAVCEAQFGELVQKSNTETWDFPAADFTAAPYFSTDIDELTIVYEDDAAGVPRTDIVLYEFKFDGVFSADGSSIEHGAIDTLVDSRGLGPLFNLADTDDAVCTFAADFGVTCAECPDGGAYCLHTIGVDIVAPWIEGLTLYPDAG